LLFFEKGKVFSRSINLGANSITQDFVNESKLKFDPAEKIKIEEGFVSLGGAYEEPENQNQAAISKIARQFMTRLHIQVNQTMQYYRGQQGGSAPQRLFLSGGASVMPYTAQFFAEKLNVPVEYFNPLRNVQIDPTINLEELARVAHSLGEVVGLGLRNLAHCPVELNLMPDSTLRWQAFNQKKPYFIATLVSLVLVVAAMGWIFDRLADVRQKELDKVKGEVAPLELRQQQFQTAYNALKKTQKETDQVVDWMNDRYYWADLLSQIRVVLIRVEQGTKAKLGTDAGVWIEQFAAPPVTVTEGLPGMQPIGQPPPGELERGRPAPVEQPPQPAQPPQPGGAPAGTNAAPDVAIVFRAVSLNSMSASANTDLAFAVLNELKTCPMIEGDQTTFPENSNVSEPEPPGTFTFRINVKLKRLPK
jgi:hypothetical protein